MTTDPTGWTAADRAREQDLLARLGADDERARQGAREELVHLHLPLVRALARRFPTQRIPAEDVVQVGVIGLLNAIDRYDPDRGTALSTFATPTILGEIKRCFRDSAWALHVPRRVKELVSVVTRRADELTVGNGRAPTVGELAEDLGLTEEEVLEALEAQHAGTTDPFDLPAVPDVADGSTGAFDAVDDRDVLRPLLAGLTARQRRVLTLRFVDGLSQVRIAEEIGVSQMQVSRILGRTLAQLRTTATSTDDA